MQRIVRGFMYMMTNDIDVAMSLCLGLLVKQKTALNLLQHICRLVSVAQLLELLDPRLQILCPLLLVHVSI